MAFLYQERSINFREVYWQERKNTSTPAEEANEPMVEDLFRVLAHFLRKLTGQESFSTPASIVKFFREETVFGREIGKMKELVVEDNLFKNLIEELGGDQRAQVIVALLENDEAKLEKALK